MGSKGWRWIKTAAYYLLLAVAGLLVLLIGVNAFDAPESTDYQALQAVTLRPDSVPAENNSFFTVLGLYAPAEMDAAKTGRARFDTARRMDAEGTKKVAAQAPNSSADAKRFAPDPAILKLCSLSNCVSNVAVNLAEVETFLKANREPLDRFSGLLPQPYEGPLRPDFHLTAEILPGIELMHINDTRLLYLAALVAQGKDEEALRGWSESLAFAQRVQAGSRDLIGSVIGMAMQHKHYGWLMNFIQSHPERARVRLPTLRKLAVTPPDGSAAFSNVIASECYWVARSFLNPDLQLTDNVNLPQSALSHFMKRQSSANETADLCAHARAILAQKPGSVEYGGALLDAAPDKTKLAVLRGFWPYNIVGKVYVSALSTDWRPYIYRRDTVLADSLLIQLALDVMELPVADKAAVDALLARPGFRHPFLLEPMTWQADGKAISFPTSPADMTGEGVFKNNIQFEPAKVRI